MGNVEDRTLCAEHIQGCRAVCEACCFLESCHNVLVQFLLCICTQSRGDLSYLYLYVCCNGYPIASLAEEHPMS